jgi:hypothetical protein
MDDRKIVGGSRTSPLTTELFEASADYREIVGCTASGHISSPLSVRSPTGTSAMSIDERRDWSG